MKERLFTFVKFSLIAIFIILVAVQSGKSLVLDEIDFPIVSDATSQTGKPIYYRGEASPEHNGTYHPTLYINSLAAFIRFFGFSETSVRFFGIICTLASLYLLILILRQLTKKSEGNEALLTGLFLLNPYTIANTTLPDIDSTVLPVAILLFTYLSIYYLSQKKNKLNNKVIIILGAVFGLALWTKLTTPLILPPLLACLAAIYTKDYMASIRFTLKVTLFGLASFLITYFLYSLLLDLSFSYTFEFLLDSFKKGTSGESTIAGIAKNLSFSRYFIYWPTLPIIGLLGVSALGIVLSKNTTQESLVKKVLLALALSTTVFYLALIAPFGGFFKYPFPVFGLFILTIVFFYDSYLQNRKLNLSHIAAAFIAGMVIENIYWKDSMFLDRLPFENTPLLILIVLIAYILLTMRKTHQLTASVITLFMVFSIGFQLSISRTQAIANYPTKYHYGQTGLDQTTAYLRSNAEPNEVIWAMKDVGYYTNNRYYESYSYYFNDSLQEHLQELLKGGDVRYYVVTANIGQDNIFAFPKIQKILNENATIEKRFGDFIIYKANQ